jgi:hypothetical protein
MDPFFKPYDRPVRIHLLQGKRGLAGEISDLREDVSSAFSRVSDTVISSGSDKAVKLTVGYSSSIYQSTTIIPANAKITEVITEITTAYNNGATLAVKIHGMSDLNLQLPDENNPAVCDVYVVEPLVVVSSAQSGKIQILIGATPSVGEATVTVKFIEQFLG